MPPAEPLARLALAVDPRLAALADPGRGPHTELRRALEAELDQLLRTLGVPGQADVSIRAAQTDLAGEWADIQVNGERCRCPDELLRRTRAVVLGDHGTEEDQRPIRSWLVGLPADDHALLLAWCQAAVAAALVENPAALLGPAQVAAYRELLGARPDAAWLGSVLRGGLDLKVSVADRATVDRVLAACADLPPSDALEELLPELRPDVVKLRLPTADLRALTTSAPDELAGMFADLRGVVFTELGLDCPAFQLVADDRLRRHALAVTVNHLTLPAWLGLAPDECLVNAPPAAVAAAGLPVRGPLVNPLSRLPETRIALEAKAESEQRGWTTWTPARYPLVVLAAELRRHGRCLVDRTMVRKQMARLGVAFPALVRATQAVVPEARLTSVLRSQAAEQRSSRNLRAIAERLLDAGSATVTDPRQEVAAPPA